MACASLGLSVLNKSSRTPYHEGMISSPLRRAVLILAVVAFLVVRAAAQNSDAAFASSLDQGAPIFAQLQQVKRTLQKPVTPPPAAPRFVLTGIHGQDDRLEVFQADASKRALADSVASLWEESSLKYDPKSGTYKLLTENYGEKLGLCPTEAFREQPAGPNCTATLVGEDVLLTAGHCVLDDKACAQSRFVFGFAITDPGGSAPSSVPSTEVYACAEVVSRYVNPNGARAVRADYALIRLDRKVSGHRIVPISRDDGLAEGDAVFTMGYPFGLPLKVAGGATVRDVSAPGFFVSDVDALVGNSGSPIFNERTNAIEGVLFAGDDDLAWNDDETCYILHRGVQDEGIGEWATKASLFRALIPPPPRTQQLLPLRALNLPGLIIGAVGKVPFELRVGTARSEAWRGVSRNGTTQTIHMRLRRGIAVGLSVVLTALSGGPV